MDEAGTPESSAIPAFHAITLPSRSRANAGVPEELYRVGQDFLGIAKPFAHQFSLHGPADHVHHLAELGLDLLAFFQKKFAPLLRASIAAYSLPTPVKMITGVVSPLERRIFKNSIPLISGIS